MRWIRSLIIREGIGIGLNIKEKNARKRMEYKPFKDARYEITVSMVENYSDNIAMIYPFVVLMAVIEVIACIVMVVFCKDKDQILRAIPLFAIVFVLFIGLIYKLKRAYRYATYSQWGLYRDKVGVIDYRQEIEYYSYQQLREQILSKKIRIREGRIDVPCGKGYMPISCYKGETQLSALQYLAKRVGITLPSFDKKLGAIRLNTMVQVIWLSGVFIILFICLMRWSIAFMDGEFDTLEQFIQFIRSHMMGMLTGFLKFTVFQLIVGILFRLRVICMFWKNRDIMKVV